MRPPFVSSWEPGLWLAVDCQVTSILPSHWLSPNVYSCDNVNPIYSSSMIIVYFNIVYIYYHMTIHYHVSIHWVIANQRAILTSRDSQQPIRDQAPTWRRMGVYFTLYILLSCIHLLIGHWSFSAFQSCSITISLALYFTLCLIVMIIIFTINIFTMNIDL